MKTKLLIIGFALILALFTFAKDGFSAWTANPTSINFGDVPLGTSKTVVIVVTNTGTYDILITGVYPSITEIKYSIYTPDLAYPPVKLAPGEIITIAITFTPSTRGNYSGEVVITSNDPANPSVNIPFTGTSTYTSALSVSPTIINFGDIPLGTSKVSYLTITNTGTSVAQNIRISSSHPDVTFDTTSIGSLNPGQSRTIKVTFTPTARGSYIGEISIIYDAPTSQSITIPFTGISSYAAGIDVSPSSIDFGSVPAGSSKEEVVRVKNNGNSELNVTVTMQNGVPFKVVRIDLNGIRQDVEGKVFKIIPGQMETFIVTFSPTQKGVFTGALTIMSDDVNTPKITVSLRGDTGAEFGLALFPTIMNFGNVMINTTYDKLLTIYNVSSRVELVSLTIINVNGDAFSFPPTMEKVFYLIPGEKRQIPIRFYPTDTVNYSGFVYIDTYGGTASISLLGTGSETGTAGLEPQNPPPSSGGGGGGGCSITGSKEASTFGNAVLMFLPAIAIALRKLYRKIR